MYVYRSMSPSWSANASFSWYHDEKKTHLDRGSGLAKRSPPSYPMLCSVAVATVLPVPFYTLHNSIRGFRALAITRAVAPIHRVPPRGNKQTKWPRSVSPSRFSVSFFLLLQPPSLSLSLSLFLSLSHSFSLTLCGINSDGCSPCATLHVGCRVEPGPFFPSYALNASLLLLWCSRRRKRKGK